MDGTSKASELAKSGNEAWTAVSNQVQPGPTGLYLLGVAVQLHSMLTAVDSAKVAHKDQHRCLISPQALDRDRLVAFRQHGVATQIGARRFHRPQSVALGGAWRRFAV